MNSNDRIIEKKDFIIIIDKGFEKQNFDCPVCKLCIRGLEDLESIEAYGMCKDCQEEFYWTNKIKWENGWRPKKEEINEKLNNYYLIRRK